MKRNILNTSLGFIISIVFLSLRIPSDYRDAYLGNYICSSKCHILNDTIVQMDTLTIMVMKNEMDSILNISIDGTLLKVKLIGNSMYSYQASIHFGGKFFASDSIGFSLTSRLSSLCFYVGKK